MSIGAQVSELVENISEEPWLYAGPFVVLLFFIYISYIATMRIIDDQAWAPRKKAPQPGTMYLNAKMETPASSLLLSKGEFIKYHQWQYINLFQGQVFPVEVIENSIRIATKSSDMHEKDMSFLAIKNEELKQSVEDIMTTGDTFLEGCFTSAPYLITISCSEKIQKMKIGIAVGLFLASLRSSGIWANSVLLSQEESHSIESLLAKDNRNSCGRIVAIIAIGYPTRNYLIEKGYKLVPLKNIFTVIN